MGVVAGVCSANHSQVKKSTIKKLNSHSIETKESLDNWFPGSLKGNEAEKLVAD